MKKTLFTALTTLFTFYHCFPQDTITYKSNESIIVKVIELTTTEVKYKKYEYMNGPIYTILKSDILVIRYENGTQDRFNGENKIDKFAASTETSGNLFIKGQKDAEIYYKGYRGAGTTTLIVGLLSPLVGLIPAIACSSTAPKETNLNYPSTDLKKFFDYKNGYAQKSKKIKKGKVWTNWGIAFGVNIIAYLMLTSGK